MQQLDEVRDKWLGAAKAAASLEDLERVRVEALGKKGEITQFMKTLGGLGPEERREAGQRLNALKEAVAAALDARKTDLAETALDARLAKRAGRRHPAAAPGDRGPHPSGQPDHRRDRRHLRRDGLRRRRGAGHRGRLPQFHRPQHPAGPSGAPDARHLLSAGAGRRRAAGAAHPYLAGAGPPLCRSIKPPIRIIAPGRTYRCDSDMTHTPMFHQVEGLVIDETTHMGHLKGCLIDFCRAFFGVADLPVRFRPSFFPFTEPSAELDIGCSRAGGELRIGAGSDWLEILGCGMVHPKVLEMCGIDPDALSGLRLRHGHRAHRHAEIRHPRPAHLLRRPTCAGCAITASCRSTCPTWSEGSRDEVHALLAEGASRDRGRHRRDRAPADHARPRGREHRRSRPAISRPSPSAMSWRPSSIPMPTGCGSAWSIPAAGQVQVVCGAPNARTGMKGVFAPSGSHIPGTGLELKAGHDPRRRIQRHALLRCASWGWARIMTASSSCPTTRRSARPSPRCIGLDDPVIDVKVTPDRGRLPGRAPASPATSRPPGLGRLKPRDLSPVTGSFESPIRWQRDLPAGQAERLPAGRRPLFPRRQERPLARAGCRTG